MTKRRYCFFDIDGTLAAGGYEHTYIPDSTREALQRLRDAGHFVAIATGRSQALAVDLMHELGFHHMVSDGGYGVTIDDELQGIRPISKEHVIKLIEECKQKGYAWGLQVDNSDTRLVPDKTFLERSKDTFMKTQIVPGLDPRNYDKIYKAYVACRYPEELQLESLKDLPWCRFHETYFFVEPSDKAYGIKQVLRHFDADLEDAVVFGDSGNDISMFQDDWTKVAMGNAIPKLKELADYITTDVSKNGIYNACKALGLFRKCTV